MLFSCKNKIQFLPPRDKKKNSQLPKLWALIPVWNSIRRNQIKVEFNWFLFPLWFLLIRPRQPKLSAHRLRTWPVNQTTTHVAWWSENSESLAPKNTTVYLFLVMFLAVCFCFRDALFTLMIFFSISGWKNTLELYPCVTFNYWSLQAPLEILTEKEHFDFSCEDKLRCFLFESVPKWLCF